MLPGRDHSLRCRAMRFLKSPDVFGTSVVVSFASCRVATLEWVAAILDGASGPLRRTSAKDAFPRKRLSVSLALSPRLGLQPQLPAARLCRRRKSNSITAPLPQLSLYTAAGMTSKVISLVSSVLISTLPIKKSIAAWVVIYRYCALRGAYIHALQVLCFASGLLSIGAVFLKVSCRRRRCHYSNYHICSQPSP